MEIFDLSSTQEISNNPIRRPSGEKVSTHVEETSTYSHVRNEFNFNMEDSSIDDMQSSYTAPEDRIVLSWSKVCVRAPMVNKKSSIKDQLPCYKNSDQEIPMKTLLKNCYGLAKPGRVLAIIGSSGAGKSTLMNILMGRIAQSIEVSGKIKANGVSIGKGITKLSAYLQQDDIFHPCFTVGNKFQHRNYLEKS